MSPLIICLLAILGFFLFITLLLSVVLVNQQSAKVVQRFGKYRKVASAGLSFKVPWIDWVAGEVNLRVRELKVEVETKTEDNVFVKVVVSIQFFVPETKIYEAFYKLQDLEKQVSSYVFDVVRATVPKIKLDDVFERKDDVANAVKSELAATMGGFGYEIVKALVTDIDPDKLVKAAMNEINAAQRQRVAANEKGEADKILQVKKAEAEAEAKKLQGQGIANQRKAIIEGLKESVNSFKDSVGGTAQDVMNLVMMTQYFDTMKEIGASSKTNVLFTPNSPAGLTDTIAQIKAALLISDPVQVTPTAGEGEKSRK